VSALDKELTNENENNVTVIKIKIAIKIVIYIKLIIFKNKINLSTRKLSI